MMSPVVPTVAHCSHATTGQRPFNVGERIAVPAAGQKRTRRLRCCQGYRVVLDGRERMGMQVSRKAARPRSRTRRAATLSPERVLFDGKPSLHYDLCSRVSRGALWAKPETETWRSLGRGARKAPRSRSPRDAVSPRTLRCVRSTAALSSSASLGRVTQNGNPGWE